MFFKTKRVQQQEEVVTVEAIHNDFYKSSESALEEAKKIIDASATSSVKKAERLSALGFYNAKEVTENAQLKSKEQNARLMLDYLVRYPNYKFIREDQVKALCAKYHLVLGEVNRYKGEVPEKNLREIEAFKMHKQDQLLNYGYPGHSGFSGNSDVSRYYNTYTPTLMICAPSKDFVQNSRTQIKDGYRLEVKDPIVLQPITGGYLILTAWGPEAKDENVINPIKN